MEEIIRPVLELSYDIRGCDCLATCRITYPPSDSAYPFDFSILDDIPQDTTAKDRLRLQLVALLERCNSLDCSHQRLSQEYLLLQSTLFASANTASALLEATNESEQLRQQVAKERAVACRLRQRLKERDLRKSGAELLLQQAESRIKELIFANGMLTKRAADAEKSAKEMEARLERSKEGVEGLTKLVSQRDEQVKRLILRVKAQDSAIGELQEERKRQAAATKRQKQALDSKSVSRSDSELSLLRSQLQARETELEILKSMLKNAHSPMRGATLRIPKQCSVQLPQIRSTSNSKSCGKLPQRTLVEETVRKAGTREAGSLALRLNRADSNSESAVLRENLSQSPFDFQEEDYEDLPELDFRPIQEVSLEL